MNRSLRTLVLREGGHFQSSELPSTAATCSHTDGDDDPAGLLGLDLAQHTLDVLEVPGLAPVRGEDG